jgi:hypothetical protein
MLTRVEDLQFGDSTIAVCAVQLPGSEDTGIADKMRARAVDALARAEASICSVAKSGAHTAERLRENAGGPSTLEIELGLAFTVDGDVIVAGGSIEASLVVKLGYELKS